MSVAMPDRLQEIRARLANAVGDGSAMPWQHDDPGECVRSVNGREIASVPFYDERDLIAHAPDDIAWLLAELDVARVRNERLAKRLAEQVPWEDAR